MATANQIALARAREEERANRAQEKETHRSNKEKEWTARAEQYNKYGSQATWARHKGNKGNSNPDKLEAIPGMLERGISKGVEWFGTIGRGARGLAGFDNDPSWYAKDTQLMKDSASLSFMDPVGTKLPVDLNPDTPASGFCILRYAPVVGAIPSTNIGASAINIAAKNFYSFVRHANSGSRNYEPNDLMLHIMCVNSVYEYISHMIMLYSLLRTYKIENRFFARTIIYAMGYDFDDLIAHISDLRYEINRAITNAGIFALPKDITYTARRVWLNTHYWYDSPVKKAQLYFFMPRYLYQFDIDSGTSLGYADIVGMPQPSDDMTFAGIQQTITTLIDHLNSQEDIGIISGDILKAYGEGGVYRFSQIPSDFHVEGAYSAEVLSQIHNAKILPVRSTDIKLIQDDINLKYSSVDGDLTVVLPNTKQRLNTLFDLYKDNPTPEDNMVASRLTALHEFYEWSDGSYSALYHVRGAGTEVICELNVFYGEAETLQNVTIYSYILDKGVTADANNWVSLQKYAVQFHLFPEVILVTHNNTAPQAGVCDSLLFETENWTKLAVNELSKMSTCAVMSELSIPMAGLSRRG